MFNISGGVWVDIFGLVMLVRLILPLFGLHPMTMAEASLWAATITSFAYSNGGPKQS